MNIQELVTWNRLLALDFDDRASPLSFSARLARDNGWSRRFATRAIDEYRKFCFLAVHAGHPVTPSDEVDQVWHLHLTYSRHYWDELCRTALKRPLHHGPTQGGAREDRKYRDWYAATLKSYRRYFGDPPKQLWPAAAERFDVHNDFVRINRRDVVTVDRSVLRRAALASLAGGAAIAAGAALAQAEGAAAGPGVVFGVLVAVALPLMLIVAALRARRRNGAKAAKRSTSDGGAAVVGGSSGKGSCDGPSGDGGSSGCGAAAGCGGAGCGGS